MSKRKPKARRIAPTKPIKIAALIMTAIQNLRESKGSSPNKIVDYITFASDLPQGKIKPQVNAALKRGIEYGILKRFRGHYFLETGDDLDRADKIAARFAQLPTLVNSRPTNKTTSPKGFPIRKLPKVRPAVNSAQRSLSLNLQKGVKNTRSMPLSLKSTATEKSYYRGKRSSFESDVDSHY